MFEQNLKTASFSPLVSSAVYRPTQSPSAIPVFLNPNQRLLIIKTSVQALVHAKNQGKKEWFKNTFHKVKLLLGKYIPKFDVQEFLPYALGAFIGLMVGIVLTFMF